MSGHYDPCGMCGEKPHHCQCDRCCAKCDGRGAITGLCVGGEPDDVFEDTETCEECHGTGASKVANPVVDEPLSPVEFAQWARIQGAA